MGSTKIKLSLAANYDAELIPELAKLSVDEVYGKLPVDGISGGRPRYMSSCPSKKEFFNYIYLLRKHGIEFNYLLNGSCMGNREWTRSWQKKLMSLMDTLGAMGVSCLTVSTPFLLELVKKRFPEFKVKTGIYAQVDTPERARFWEGLGADCITLESFSVNRDFQLLSEIREAVNCELQLIANHICLPNCPMQPYHQNGFAHASEKRGAFFIDYCFLRCTRKRLEDPALIIKSAWIRPEDLDSYAEIGYNRFKLLERDIPSTELLKRAKAYSEGCSGENLADLLFSHGFREPPKQAGVRFMRHFFKPMQVNPFKLKDLFAVARQQGMLFPMDENPVKIDSGRIPPDFLDKFKSGSCRNGQCSDCGYCASIAAEAVSISPEFRRESLSRLSELEQNLAKGSLWNV